MDNANFKQALIVYNSAAGTAKTIHEHISKIQAVVCEELGYQAEQLILQKDTGRNFLQERAREMKALSLILAVGGDGTVSAVLEAAANLEEEIPIAIIPVGTGNLLARTLGAYPCKMHRRLWKYAADLYFSQHDCSEVIEHAFKVLKNGVLVKYDLASTNNRLMAIGAGIGPLADAITQPKPHEKQSLGMLAYAWSLLKLAGHSHRKFLVKIEDEEPFEVEATGIFVSNLPNLGIGTPENLDQVHDGLMDLFVVDCHGLADFFKLWWRFFLWLQSNERVAPYLTRRIRKVSATVIENSTTPSLRRPRVALDGDPRGQGPLEVTVIPSCATVYVPTWLVTAAAPDKVVSTNIYAPDIQRKTA